MGAYNEALAEAGIIRDGGGLRPTRYGARVRFDGDSRTILKGPFELTSDLGLDTGYGKSRIWKRQSVG